MKSRSPRGLFLGRPSWSVAVLFLLAASLSSGATFPLRWRWSNPRPHGNNITDIAYSEILGLAVQVCERGQIYTSSDLVLWLPRDSGTDKALRGVTFFGSRILVTGEAGTVLYADEPDSFHPGTLATGPTLDWLEGVAASPVLAVAVGDNGAVYRSLDGETWTRHNLGASVWLRGVAYGGGVFVAVGENGFIATSTNGRFWTQRSSGTSAHLNRITYWNGRFVVVGDGGVVLVSLNGGGTWYRRNSGATGDLLTVAGDTDALVVAGDQEARVLIGSSWFDQLSSNNGPPAWTYLSSIGRTGFFLLGGRSGVLAEGYRTNLTHYLWLLTDDSIRHWLFDMTYQNGLFTAVGDYATVLTSGDGIDWALEVPPPSATNAIWLGIGGTSNLLVSVGTGGALMTSPNLLTNITVTNYVGTNWIVTNETVSTYGVLWEAIEPRPTSEDLQGVCASDQLFVVTGGNGVILTSPDGRQWTVRTAPVPAFLSGVTAYPGGFVAVGTEGTLLHSTDGTTWTLRPTGTTNWLYKVRYVGGALVAVGENGTLLTSADGLTWTTRETGTTEWLNDVTWVDDVWFVVGTYGTVLTSTNLVQWTDRGTITRKALYAAATDGQKLILAGVEGAILRAQVVPELSPVNILSFSRSVTNSPPEAHYLFLFGGKPDQRFTLDSRTTLDDGDAWVTGPLLEIYDSSGTLFYLETVPNTNEPPQNYYRTTLVP